VPISVGVDGSPQSNFNPIGDLQKLRRASNGLILKHAAESDVHTHEGIGSVFGTDKKAIAVKRSLFICPSEPMVVGTYPQRE
jgi:hypothetical protein